MTTLQRKRCERAFRIWDRASAFGCAVRKVPYDAYLARLYWRVYLDALNVSGVNTAGL